MVEGYTIEQVSKNPDEEGEQQLKIFSIIQPTLLV
jgi:hypothetical protein